MAKDMLKLRELERANDEITRATDLLLDQNERVLSLRAAQVETADALVLLRNMQESLLGMYRHRLLIRQECQDSPGAIPLRVPGASKGARWMERVLRRRALYRQSGIVR